MASWKKVLVSGSSAAITSLTADTTVTVGSTSYNVVGTDQSNTRLSGSFTGSFTGDGSGLRNLSANAIFPTTSLAELGDNVRLFVSESGNKFISGSQISTYVFSKVAGNITIGADGTATIANDSVALGTKTTGNYVATIGAATNAGIDVTGTAGESTTATVGLKNASGMSNNVLQKWDNTNSQLTNTSLIDNGTVVSGNSSIQLTGIATSLTGSFSGSFYGAGIGSLSSALTLGQGLTNSGSTFNGTSAVTVAVGLGTLITTSSNNQIGVKISNLNENIVPMYNGGYLSGSSISVTGSNVTVGGSLNVQGNITASGTLTYLNVQNLAVTDQYIILNSGSNDASRDSGIIVNSNTSTTSGSAFYLAHRANTLSPGRWAIASPVGIKDNNSNLTANEWMVSAKINSTDPGATVPQWGGSTYGVGNMWINSTSGDIFIYTSV